MTDSNIITTLRRCAQLPMVCVLLACLAALNTTACSDADAQQPSTGTATRVAEWKISDYSGPSLTPQASERISQLLIKLDQCEDLSEAFALAEEIEDFGRPAVVELSIFVWDLPELPRIAGLRALYNLREWDMAVRGLAEIAGGKGERDDRLAAAELLAVLASPRHKTFLEAALDNTYDTPVRIELSLALWESAKSTKAKKDLHDLLTSDSENFQIQAAIALGRIGEISQAKDVLTKLADEPTDRGLIAQELLRRESLIREYERAYFDEPEEGSTSSIKIDTSILGTTMEMLQERYVYADRVDAHRLTEMAASGVLRGFDAYSVYLNEKLARRAADVRRFRVDSLGISVGSTPLSENTHTEVPVIVAVEDYSPAHRAGLRPGDLILNVAPGVDVQAIRDWRNGKQPEYGQTADELFFDGNLAQKCELLKGQAESHVALMIRRDGWLLNRWVLLTHESWQSDNIHYELLPGGIALVAIHELSVETPARFKEILKQAHKDDAQGMLLDLRNCAMGSVSAASQIASMMLPEDSLICYSMDRSGEREGREIFAQGEFRDTSLPLTALISESTADSAEILVAALEDHERAVIAGTPSFGRAIVQDIFPISFKPLGSSASESSSHALLLTTGYYYTPVTDRRISGSGIKPTLELAAGAGYEGWVYDELDDMRYSGTLATYVNTLLTQHHDAMIALATWDGSSTKDYPNWDAFKAQLDNHLEDEHLRRFVRRELRMHFRRNGELPGIVDFQEDLTFTTGLKEIAERAKVDLTQYDEYRWISAK